MVSSKGNGPDRWRDLSRQGKVSRNDERNDSKSAAVVQRSANLLRNLAPSLALEVGPFLIAVCFAAAIAEGGSR